MGYEYDLSNNVLYINKNYVQAYDIEENEIGICGACGAHLLSISYHLFNDLIIVAKCSSCNLIFANIYDQDWVWLDEIVISHFLPENTQNRNAGCDNILQTDGESDISAGLKLLKSIPMKQLQTIFSPAEINAMFLRTKGDEYIRQYLYNARKKYGAFEDVFGITINI